MYVYKLVPLIDRYVIIDVLTGRRERHSYATRKAAQRKADVLDSYYGAIRYRVECVPADTLKA